jgi:hypothetical protein
MGDTVQIENVKKWWPFAAIAVPLLWLGFYAWAWTARHGCAFTPIGECWATAAASWGADVFMFKWVDTTLAGGMLAAGAAIAVVWTAAFQRANEVHDRLDARKVELTMIMWTVHTLFERASFVAAAEESIGASLAVMSEAHAFLPQLVRVNPGLASIVQLSIIDGKRHMQNNPADWKFAAGLNWLLARYFDDPGRLFDARGNYVPNRQVLRESDVRMLSNLGHKPADFEFAKALFRNVE